LKNLPNILILIFLGILGGCQGSKTSPASLELTFNRGAQLLAAGNPKAAIPFLSQTIAATPDGPEPVALLALAFALDLQSEQAILEARMVRRPTNHPPGWEAVAVGIAETVRRRPEEAIASFQRVLATAPAESALVPATRQWLALAQVIHGDHDAALVTLKELAKQPSMKTSALLWILLIHARYSQTQPPAGTVLYSANNLTIRARDWQTPLAAEALIQCAGEIATTFRKPAYEDYLDDQTLYDSAIGAIADGKFDHARQLLATLQGRETDGGDATLWMALIDAAQGRWQAARNGLADACENGPLPARGLASQLCAVVYAMEDRPESMIQRMLAGQSMMGRNTSPAHIIETSKPESVWFSDAVN